MFEFLRAIFLGKTILLSSLSTDIGPSYTMHLAEPIHAITDGASVQIDVSAVVSPALGPQVVPAEVRRAFPRGSVTGSLRTKKDSVVKLVYNGAILYSEEDVRILLVPATQMPIEEDFVSVTISSAQTIPAAKIYWRNNRLK